MTVVEINAQPTTEKVRIMEDLWEDLWARSDEALTNKNSQWTRGKGLAQSPT
jgi:hypothetical protein